MMTAELVSRSLNPLNSPTLSVSSRKHHPPFTFKALQTDIGADPINLPIKTTTWVLLLKGYTVVNLKRSSCHQTNPLETPT
jgi:hypothetical protein